MTGWHCPRCSLMRLATWCGSVGLWSVGSASVLISQMASHKLRWIKWALFNICDQAWACPWWPCFVMLHDKLAWFQYMYQSNELSPKLKTINEWIHGLMDNQSLWSPWRPRFELELWSFSMSRRLSFSRVSSLSPHELKVPYKTVSMVSVFSLARLPKSHRDQAFTGEVVWCTLNTAIFVWGT